MTEATTDVVVGDPKGEPHPTGPEERPRCTAHSRTSGQRCKQPPIAGGTVRVYHGGKAPQVRRKAALRMVELVDPAIATVARIMTDQNAKEADRLRAAENVLDRAGVSRKAEVTSVDAAKDLLVERLMSIRDGRETE